MQVNWELRLSKREAALRIAEEMLLEEQQKVSEAQLAVARCEEALKQREQAGKQDKEVKTFKPKLPFRHSTVCMSRFPVEFERFHQHLD